MFCFSAFKHLHEWGLNKRVHSYLPSLTSSIKARPACFWREFCHSCEHSNITNSTTDVLCFSVTRPAVYKNKGHYLQKETVIGNHQLTTKQNTFYFTYNQHNHSINRLTGIVHLQVIQLIIKPYCTIWWFTIYRLLLSAWHHA